MSPCLFSFEMNGDKKVLLSRKVCGSKRPFRVWYHERREIIFDHMLTFMYVTNQKQESRTVSRGLWEL